MLFHFENQHRAVFTVDFEGGVDGRQHIAFAIENHIDYRADHLCYFSEIFAHFYEGVGIGE